MEEVETGQKYEAKHGGKGESDLKVSQELANRIKPSGSKLPKRQIIIY